MERLILIGAYVQGLLARSHHHNARLEAETLANLVQLGWGKDVPAFNQVFTNLFIPDGTREQHAWWQSQERETSSPQVACRTLGVLNKIDVTSAVTTVDLPTLVFHARGDARIPYEEGRRLAAALPRAEFVSLDSANHILLEHEPAWDVFKARVREFLTNTQSSHRVSRDCELTAAETAVSGLIAKGLGNAEIATSLGKSEKTVRNQITAIFEKTGVQTRSELIVKILSGD